MSNFASKMAGETQYLSFDFSEFLQPDEKLVFASVEAKVAKSKDPEYKKFVYGNCLIEGAIVSQRVTGGKSDVTYKLIATVETSKKQVLKLAGNIQVVPDLEIEEDLPEEDVVIADTIVEEIVTETVVEEPVAGIIAGIIADVVADPVVEELVETVEEVVVEEQKSDDTIYEIKVNFDVVATKEINRDGSKYGIVEGYASTYNNVDRVKDRVMPGAFVKSVAKHFADGRQIRMYYQHDSKEIIGGFNPAYISEDPQGLKVVGEINLEVQRGREVYALAKQGVLGDFSIGYTVKDFDIKDGIRQLREIDLWEISIVSEPANPKAKILQVKKSDVERVKSRRDVEKLLRDSGLFSRSASAYLASLTDESKFIPVQQEEEPTQRDVELDNDTSVANLLADIKLLVEKL